ncbi:MAG: hypothetical protein HKN47_21875 [Pirellulaceae bacterium]|nr:hypothetical protein [Pirellulaceae bacterium]
MLRILRPFILSAAILLIGLSQQIDADDPIDRGTRASTNSVADPPPGLADKLRGLQLIEELNCISCHRSDSALLQASKQAPRLKSISQRVNPYYLTRFLRSPHKVKPGTTMPDVIRGADVVERQQVAESIVQFLLSRDRSSPFRVTGIDAVAAEKGELLFHSVGCAACHPPRNKEAVELLTESSVPLGALEQKYSFGSLVDFIERPHVTRPSGRMPDLRLPRLQIEQIASYLLRETRVPGHLNYTLYRGKVWEGLDQNTDKVMAGLVDDFELANIQKLQHNSAIVYEGFLSVSEPGEYQFWATLNGGELRINDVAAIKLVASNRRGVKNVTGTVNVNEGWNSIRLTYYHTGREPSLKLEMEGPGFPRQAIRAGMLSISKTPIAVDEPYPTDRSQVAAGERNFAAMGCVACHDDVGVDPSLVAARILPLAQTNVDKGCLSDEAGEWPRFALTPKQRQLIRDVVPQIDSLALTDSETIDKTLVTFRCIACHDRGTLGGVPPERNHLFTGTRPELGNDGRIPPPLDHVGAKLQQNELVTVLHQDARRRPYLNTRMPRFGNQNVGHLPELFRRVDQIMPVVFDKIEDVATFKEAGRELVGAKGFSCIACHDFNGQRAIGPGALDIIDTTQRLQKDWFYWFMLKPNRFRIGTIMPSAWPDGHVFKKELLGGDVKKQIESIWVYLSDGQRAKNPVGLSRQAKELRVTNVAEMCRGRGTAGYRGIGVGYPERLNLAFDSEQMNLRLIWKDEFVNIDHGSFRARGRDRIEFPDGIPFHRLESMDDNWPYKRKADYLFPQDHGYLFKGYYLDDQRRPTWMYRYGDVKIEEFFEDRRDEKDQAYFLRRFTFDAPEPQPECFFRAAAGKNVRQVRTQSDREFRVQNLSIKITSDHRGQVRKGDQDELLIPLRIPRGRSTLTLEYKW